MCLIPVSLCLCNFGFGWQLSAWLSIDRTQLILLNFGGAIVVEIFIHQVKRSFCICILIFTVSLICCLMISWLLWHLYQHLSVWSSCSLLLPTFPKGWFVEKSSFCPASYEEHATFMVQILNCLQFQNQKFISKNVFWFQYMSHPCLLLCVQKLVRTIYSWNVWSFEGVLAEGFVL